MSRASGPLRIAIIGAGPAGFYAAGALLDSEAGIEADLIERLPTPWGLVRNGVAPDHQRMKLVSGVFERIAARPGFRFLGNVEVGRDLGHDDLMRLYDAVIYAQGAQADRRLGLPGEDLPGSWPAAEFVAWYNGHPDHQDLAFRLDVPRAVVIGNGNVALDVARMLARTERELAPTDATDAARRAIATSAIEEILVLGRRGPAQAAFTHPELRELGALAGADVVVNPADLKLDAAGEWALEDDANARRNVALLRDFATRPPAGRPRRLVLRFLCSPTAIRGSGHVEAIEVVRNRLAPDGSGGLQAIATGQRETIRCGLVFRSVGYRGLPLGKLPFDGSRGTIANQHGRVLDESGRPLMGVYCTGWIKRGPRGVIGTNKKDSIETAGRLLEDVRAGRLQHRADVTAAEVDRLLAERGIAWVSYQGWQTIDALERTRGLPQGRPRVKLTSWTELLDTALTGANTGRQANASGKI